MDLRPGYTYRIAYRSESGRQTERTIDVLRKNSSRVGIIYFRAYCHLRDEERSFRSDRIVSCSDLGLTIQSASYSPAATHVGNTIGVSQALATISAPMIRESLFMPSPPQPKPVSHSSRPAKDHSNIGTVFGKFVWTAICGFMAVTIIGAISQWDSSSISSSTKSWPSYPGPLTVASARIPAPLPKPKPRSPETDGVLIGGMHLQTLNSGGVEYYVVPELGLQTANKREAIAAIKVPQFEAVTGIHDSALNERYLDADLDCSGKLSWDELAEFQKKTYKDFRYEPNDVALRPDEFLHIGGGDCDDFALYSAGLLRFWGWQPYLGCLSPGRGDVGHAICLSYEEGSFSSSFTYYDIGAGRTEDGSPLKAGRYVPIDYDEVGELTNASGKGWKLREIYVPEKAYGLNM